MSTTEPTPEACRFLVFFMIDGQCLGRASTAADAIRVAMEGHFGLENADALEVLDCGENGRKIWLNNQSAARPIFLHAARKRHPTVYRGSFYAAPEWRGSQLPPVELTP